MRVKYKKIINLAFSCVLHSNPFVRWHVASNAHIVFPPKKQLFYLDFSPPPPPCKSVMARVGCGGGGNMTHETPVACTLRYIANGHKSAFLR